MKENSFESSPDSVKLGNDVPPNNSGDELTTKAATMQVNKLIIVKDLEAFLKILSGDNFVRRQSVSAFIGNGTRVSCDYYTASVKRR